MYLSCCCPEGHILNFFFVFAFQFCFSNAGSEQSVAVLLEEGVLGLFLKKFGLFLHSFGESKKIYGLKHFHI